MKKDIDYLRAIAIFLLIFLIVVGVSVWLLNLVTQWRAFGFLLSAEFIAFAMLVYIFYMENPAFGKKLLAIGFVVLAVLVLLAGAVFAGVGVSPPLPKPNVSMTIYAGEISLTEYGFGNNSTSITSPGPTLTFKVGDVVNMTLFNAGTMPHNWALVTTNETSAKVLFGAQIAMVPLACQLMKQGLLFSEFQNLETTITFVRFQGTFSLGCGAAW